MIRIKTTRKKEAPSEEVAYKVARQLARYFPDFHDVVRNIPHKLDELCFVLDAGNDWVMQMDDRDNQVVSISYRYEGTSPREYAFASWVVSSNHGWRMLLPEVQGGTYSKIDVEMTVWFPEKRSEIDCGDITMEIPIENIRVDDLDGERIPGARVVAYSTGEYADIIDPETGRKKR